MKQTTLDEIIEKDVPEELYFKKKDWEKRKYLRTTLPMMCTVDGDDVYLFVEGIKPPQILKQKGPRMRNYGDTGLVTRERSLERESMQNLQVMDIPIHLPHSQWIIMSGIGTTR